MAGLGVDAGATFGVDIAANYCLPVAFPRLPTFPAELFISPHGRTTTTTTLAAWLLRPAGLGDWLRAATTRLFLSSAGRRHGSASSDRDTAARLIDMADVWPAPHRAGDSGDDDDLEQ